MTKPKSSKTIPASPPAVSGVHISMITGFCADVLKVDPRTVSEIMITPSHVEITQIVQVSIADRPPTYRTTRLPVVFSEL